MINSIQKAILSEKLDGWLFFNFLHRDSLSDKILNLNTNTINSRPWYYLVPDNGEPVKLCHAVEPDSLTSLPGKLEYYSSREQLIAMLKKYSDQYGKNWGAQFSEELTTISTLDYGTALQLQKAGINLHSSENLIQRLYGLLDEEGMTLHEAAAKELYEIVEIIWERISTYFKEEDKTNQLTEKKVQNWILEEITSRNMITEHLPIVACGKNSGNPHYAPEEHDNIIQQDSVIQFDLWAKFKTPRAIFADISWIGWTGSAPSQKAIDVFKTVTEARDGCVSFIADRLKNNKPVIGFEADKATREIIIKRGLEEGIKHRTGHGIDTDVHGSGVGLDSVEFPDKRLLLEGSCFSIEPGVYLSEFGMRTEIDAYIKDNKIVVSGPGPQEKILTIERK
ncbi:MAG: M24 family metallopeptidase [Spirochaetales bacterium]|nr:M24 family metallopeptidase [Spirochaetales bacterium]